MGRIITFEEKIDYIYRDLRAQKRAKLLKFMIILIIIGGIVTIFNGTDKKDIIDGATKVLSNIVQPITQNVIDDMVKNNTINAESISKGLIHEIEKDPTILDNFKQNDN